MKKIVCLILIVMMLLTCVGCGSTMETTDDYTSSTMFVKVEYGHTHGSMYSVVYHKETKVMYTISQDNIFTVMLDADGKPLLWEG